MLLSVLGLQLSQSRTHGDNVHDICAICHLGMTVAPCQSERQHVPAAFAHCSEYDRCGVSEDASQCKVSHSST